jgi:hypothetical protein
MSLGVLFLRAASEEFIEASTWYESKRVGLGAEFIAEIEHCISSASSHPLQFAVVRGDIRRTLPIVFRTAFISVLTIIALLSWQYFTATETRQFG